MKDPDVSLFSALTDGVTTGHKTLIPPSKNPELEQGERPDLSLHLTNWQSAEAQQALPEELVQEELNKGWLIPFPGNLDAAKREFPLGVVLANWL